MMDDDLDDAPPLLVNADSEVPNLVDSKLADLSLVKVPITIVTGTFTCNWSLFEAISFD